MQHKNLLTVGQAILIISDPFYAKLRVRLSDFNLGGSLSYFYSDSLSLLKVSVEVKIKGVIEIKSYQVSQKI